MMFVFSRFEDDSVSSVVVAADIIQVALSFGYYRFSIVRQCQLSNTGEMICRNDRL